MYKSILHEMQSDILHFLVFYCV
jgi:hypothetical protein